MLPFLSIHAAGRNKTVTIHYHHYCYYFLSAANPLPLSFPHYLPFPPPLPSPATPPFHLPPSPFLSSSTLPPPTPLSHFHLRGTFSSFHFRAPRVGVCVRGSFSLRFAVLPPRTIPGDDQLRKVRLRPC